ncbi:MAG: hypothetical protein PHO37_13500 [Kiritimatiellae bacterium]|nr:hypothetical protein [Kiritimatiellia bacterium]
MFIKDCGRLLAAMLVTVLLQRGANGCGPDFPNEVLAGGDAFFLETPATAFSSELNRICLSEPDALRVLVIPGCKIACGTPPDNREIRSLYTRDLEESLQLLKVPEHEQKRICAGHAAVREAIAKYRDYRNSWLEKESVVSEYKRSGLPIPPWYVANWKEHGVELSQKQMLPFKMTALPPGLPLEFALYLSGAGHFHGEDFEKAKQDWNKLLALPAAQRRYRGIWAVFMLGKLALNIEPEAAERHFQEVRCLAAMGFSDTLDLASSSLGWEGLINLSRKDYRKAINLYLAQHASGDSTAYASLLIVCRKIFAEQQADLRTLADDVVASRVLTAYVLSLERGMSVKSEQWLKAVEAGAANETLDADRLAWVAYRGGKFQLAESWLKRADHSTLISKWISSKLYLRQGDVGSAAVELAAITKSLAILKNKGHQEIAQLRPGNHSVTNFEQIVYCELGALQLRQGDYAESLDTLLQSGFWQDAAYVAEQVLTVDELKKYVDLRQPVQQPGAATFDLLWAYPPYGQSGSWNALHLRWLLARRLTRAGRWKEADVYYPVNVRPYLRAYIDSIRDSHDKKLSKLKRAEAAWRAACVAKHQGLEVLGYELYPDWASVDGQYDGGDYFYRDQGENLFNRVMPNEMQRVKASAPVIDKRFHYRTVALEHAWRALELMPDNDERTAQMFCAAGSWIKARDPHEADKLYKELVRRCRGTAIGQAADQLRWFPELQIKDGDIFGST